MKVISFQSLLTVQEIDYTSDLNACLETWEKSWFPGLPNEVNDASTVATILRGSFVENYGEGFLYGCMRDDSLEGIMEIGLDHASRQWLVIKNLTSNPKNLDGTPNKVKGVGSALIEKAKEIWLRRELKGIVLNHFKSAEGFYKKMGFERGNGEVGRWNFVLTAEKITLMMDWRIAV